MLRVRFLAFLLLAGALFAQQHSYTPAEIEAGGKLYQNSCGGCHGAAGNAIPGVDFGKGQFKQARTDEDLVRVIRNGVPNTAMPPSSMSELQAGNIVAYLRAMTGSAASPDRGVQASGDALRGKALVEGKGNCLTCHSLNRIGGTSAQAGPDLSGIGAPGRGQPQGRVLLDRLERALVDPSAEIAPQFRSFRLVTREGATVTGKLLNQDTFTVQLLDSTDRLVSFNKSNLREFGFVNSAMPSYRDKLTPQEISDVVSYLASLKGPANR